MGIPKHNGSLSAASRQVDWADLHVFLAVAETGSFTAAAKRLMTTQPTVSKRLDEFELRLGVTLVERGKSGVTLTDAGRFVADQAATIARTVATITQEVAMLDSEPAGEVRIVCPDALANYFLAPEIAEFQRAHPHIQFDVRAKPDDNFNADVSLQFRETKRMDDVAISLGWVHYAAFASRDYLDTYGAPQAITDAFQHRIITHVEYGEQLERWKAKQRPLQEMLDFSLKSDCGPFLVNATAAGAGIGSMPTYVARTDPRLVMVETGELARLRLWLVFDRARGELTRVRETITWLRRVFDPRENPWFREEFIAPKDFGDI